MTDINLIRPVLLDSEIQKAAELTHINLESMRKIARFEMGVRQIDADSYDIVPVNGEEDLLHDVESGPSAITKLSRKYGYVPIQIERIFLPDDRSVALEESRDIRDFVQDIRRRNDRLSHLINF